MDDKTKTGKPHDQVYDKNTNAADQSKNLNSNPYDSENLDNESESDSKDITEQDIEKDLINNDPSEGFETDIDSLGSDTFETIELDQDNPVNKEFEIGQLSLEEIKDDEDINDESAPKIS